MLRDLNRCGGNRVVSYLLRHDMMDVATDSSEIY